MLFPLRVMEETGEQVLYIDHDFMHHIPDDFLKTFNGVDSFIYYEGWQKWDEETQWWVPWINFGDHYLEYYQPLIDYWEKQLETETDPLKDSDIGYVCRDNELASRIVTIKNLLN